MTAELAQKTADVDEATSRVNVEQTKFINMPSDSLDLKGLNKSFNTFSARKAYATGLLDLALITTNFAQIKQILTSKKTHEWLLLDIFLVVIIGLSLILQFFCGFVLLFSTRTKEFIDEDERKKNLRKDNAFTFLILIITVLNLFINVFFTI